MALIIVAIAIIAIMIHHAITHPELKFPSNFFDVNDAKKFYNAAIESHEAIILILLTICIAAINPFIAIGFTLVVILLYIVQVKIQ